MPLYNPVDSTAIVDGTITTADIADGTITTADLNTSSLVIDGGTP